MTLTDKELALAEELAHSLADKVLPELVDVGMARAKASDSVKALVALFEPKVIAALDAKIDQKFAPKAGV